jgi:hypothetical protein
MAPHEPHPAAPGSAPWRLALGALLVAGLSFLAGRASVDYPPRRPPVSDPVTPERQRETWQAQAPSAPAGHAVSAASRASVPAPRHATPAIREQTRQETVVALRAQREGIVARCWPDRPGHASAPPRSVTFNVVFDGQGQEMSRSLADENGDLPPGVQSCLINSGESVRIPPPGFDIAVTTTLELR